MAAPRLVTTDPAAVTDTYAWLDDTHEIYDSHKAGWERDERRLEGGDDIFDELIQLDGESNASYAERKKSAKYDNFALRHVQTVTGHLRLHAPTPGQGLSYGTLGDVRTRDKIDKPTPAELQHYNVDGIGNDGTEMPAFFDAVDERAQATGHRWLLDEMPNLALIRAGMAARGITPPSDVEPTQRDIDHGFRSYLIEYSPLAVPNWHFRAGQLQFVVIRTPMAEPRLEGGRFAKAQNRQGYYVFVRAGFTVLGPTFAAGGWWTFDHAKKLLLSGVIPRGEIPMWVHYGRRARGTQTRPAMSSSSTTMLGQLDVSLMNMKSARNYDYWDACASREYFLGADKLVMMDVAEQVTRRTIQIGVPAAEGLGGTNVVPSIYNSSSGAVSADVSKVIIDAHYAEAREESLLQVTSTPDSSGRSKEAGFQEQKAPFLAQRARLRQQSEQTFIYFAELRAMRDGSTAEPTGYSTWREDLPLAPLVDDIDGMFDTLQRANRRSVTLESLMIETSAIDRGVWPEDEKVQNAVRAELAASAGADVLPEEDEELEPGTPPPVLPEADPVPEPEPEAA